MKYTTLPEALIVFVFLLIACGFLGIVLTIQPPQIVNETTFGVTTLPTPEYPVVIASPAATEVIFIPVTGPATVQVSNVGEFGTALVDGQGRSLYLFMGGGQYDNTRPCAGEECLEDWIPFLTNGEPAAGEGVDPNLLGASARDDGTTQVTYNGWLLYYLSTDKAPGDATGQADDNEWYLVSPSGNPIKSLERE